MKPFIFLAEIGLSAFFATPPPMPTRPPAARLSSPLHAAALPLIAIQEHTPHAATAAIFADADSCRHTAYAFRYSPMPLSDTLPDVLRFFAEEMPAPRRF